MTSYEDQMEQQADGEFTAELRARKAEHAAAAAEAVAGQVTFRVTRNMVGHPRMVTTHVRYADAASMFWQFVTIHPDDGWDVLQGIRREAGANPYDLSRAGRDFTNGDAAWSVKLEVIA